MTEILKIKRWKQVVHLIKHWICLQSAEEVIHDVKHGPNMSVSLCVCVCVCVCV